MNSTNRPPPWHRSLAIALLFAALIVSGCDRSIYVRDGVTDGDVFYILPQTLRDPDPVNQAWIAYSLSRTSCELGIGGQTPSRNSAFACEYGAREILLDTWESYRILEDAEDGYLDLLGDVRAEGFLEEYVWHYLRRKNWQPPGELDSEQFKIWRRSALAHHKPVTQLRGAWIRKAR